MFALAMLVAGAPVSIEAAAKEDAAASRACMDNPRNYEQARINSCAQASFQRADAALNAQWAKTLRVYRHSDAVNKSMHFDYTDGADNLLKGQRAWLIYREATCNAVVSLNGGGSITPMAFSNCMADLTWKRAKELATITINPNSREQAQGN